MEEEYEPIFSYQNAYVPSQNLLIASQLDSGQHNKLATYMKDVMGVKTDKIARALCLTFIVLLNLSHLNF